MPTHLIFLHLITLILFGGVYKSLRSLLQRPVTFSPLGPNIFLSNLFSYTLNLCSSFSMTNQVSYTHTNNTNFQHFTT
jgi:hypothetical protein